MTLIKITKDVSNTQLKKFLINCMSGLSLSKINKLIDNGNIKVNGKKTQWNYLLKTGDEIKIFFNGWTSQKSFKKAQKLAFLKAKPNLDIVYEDDNILVINKPRGLICQPDKIEKIDTLNNRIKKYLYEKNWSHTHESNLCHRLDKYTSGLCIAAKNSKTLKQINILWNTKAISKYYLCLCYGVFEKRQATLKAYIFLNNKNKKMEIDKEKKYKKKIITFYRVMDQKDDYAKIEVKILTGKKHQIRVHLASINHPILGDSKYNKINNLKYKFPCLCAYKLEFNFPKNHFLRYLNDKKIETKKIDFK